MKRQPLTPLVDYHLEHREEVLSAEQDDWEFGRENWREFDRYAGDVGHNRLLGDESF